MEAVERIAELERQVAELKREAPGDASGNDNAERAPQRDGWVSRRLMLGLAGAGMTGALGTLLSGAGTQPAGARPNEAEVVLGPGGSAWSVKSEGFGAPAAAGDGTTDDTVAFQKHLDTLAYFGGGVLFVPQGRYAIYGTLTMSDRVQIVGEGHSYASKGYDGTSASVILSYFDDILIDIVGTDCTLQRLLVLNAGAGRLNAEPTTPSIQIANRRATVAECTLYRQGLAGLVLRQGSGRARILRNNIIANSKQFERTTQSHGILLESVPDTIIAENDISADGVAVYSKGGSGNLIVNNFIYNAREGVRLEGQGWNAIANNRIDEHDRTGIVLDRGSRSNVISGNSIVLNGVDETAPADERAGIVIDPHSNGISPPTANAITANTFSNRIHDPKIRTQQYGVVIRNGVAGNLVAANSFLDQRIASVLDDSNGDNTVGMNVVVDEAT